MTGHEGDMRRTTLLTKAGVIALMRRRVECGHVLCLDQDHCVYEHPKPNPT